jgi:hypothetical protein
MKWALLLTAATFAALAAFAADAVETWRFDSLDKIGGHAVKVEGAPRIVDGAVVFDGVKDALFFDVHPLAGAETWTWEVIFRPDVGGAAEQRFFHLQEEGAETRMLFEIRVIDGKWCLDSYGHSGATGKALMDRTKLHELGKWYTATAVYDGREFRNYVNGVLEGKAEIALKPQGPGGASVGVRFTKVNYFKGAVYSSRFTRRALNVSDFLKAPAGLK